MRDLEQQESYVVLRLLALGDVDHDADQALGLAVRAASDDLAVPPEPDDRTVRAHDAIFRRERVLLVSQLVETSREVSVVRMEGSHVLVGFAADASATVDQVETEKRHAFGRPSPRSRDKVGFPGARAAGRESGAISRLAVAQILEQTTAVEHGRTLVGQHLQKLYVGFRKSAFAGRGEADRAEQMSVRQKWDAHIGPRSQHAQRRGWFIITQVNVLDDQGTAQLGDAAADGSSYLDPAKIGFLRRLEPP